MKSDSKVLMQEPKKPNIFGNLVKLLTGRMCMDDGAEEEEEDMKMDHTPMPAPAPKSEPEPVSISKVEPVVVVNHEMIQKDSGLKFSESVYMFVYGFLLPIAIIFYRGSSS